MHLLNQLTNLFNKNYKIYSKLICPACGNLRVLNFLKCYRNYINFINKMMFQGKKSVKLYSIIKAPSITPHKPPSTPPNNNLYKKTRLPHLNSYPIMATTCTKLIEYKCFRFHRFPTTSVIRMAQIKIR